MATSKSYFPHHFLSGDLNPSSISPESAFEFDESDLYTSNRSKSPDFHQSAAPSSRIGKKVTKRGGTPSSVPVNIPDWSKILKEEFRDNRRWDSDGDDEDNDSSDGNREAGVRIPPHEFLARTRTASFSVHEGVGRTLKGRDLSRVRNAIWEKIGFQD